MTDTNTPTWLYDTDQPDALPIPDVSPTVIGAASEAVATARITGSVGAAVTRDGATVTARRLYTVEAGRNVATNVWQIRVEGAAA